MSNYFSFPEILQGYAKRDIWNLDETGVFWKALPEGQRRKEKQVKVYHSIYCKSR